MDRVLGLLLVAFGAVCVVESYRIWNGWEGTGVMALIVGGLFITLSGILLLFPSRGNASMQWPSKQEWFGMAATGGPFALYIVFMDWLGYALSTWLFLAVVAKSLSPTRIPVIVIWTGAVAIGTYIVFRKYLLMYLPGGFLGI